MPHTTPALAALLLENISIRGDTKELGSFLAYLNSPHCTLPMMVHIEIAKRLSKVTKINNTLRNDLSMAEKKELESSAYCLQKNLFIQIIMGENTLALNDFLAYLLSLPEVQAANIIQEVLPSIKSQKMLSALINRLPPSLHPATSDTLDKMDIIERAIALENITGLPYLISQFLPRAGTHLKRSLFVQAVRTHKIHVAEYLATQSEGLTTLARDALLYECLSTNNQAGFELIIKSHYLQFYQNFDSYYALINQIPNNVAHPAWSTNESVKAFILSLAVFKLSGVDTPAFQRALLASPNLLQTNMEGKTIIQIAMDKVNLSALRFIASHIKKLEMELNTVDEEANKYLKKTTDYSSIMDHCNRLLQEPKNSGYLSIFTQKGVSFEKDRPPGSCAVATAPAWGPAASKPAHMPRTFVAHRI